MIFRMRPFPAALKRSLWRFAGAATVLALLLAWDDPRKWWLPAGLLLAAWLIPAAFAWQVSRQGFDPLLALETSETGVLARFKDGETRFLPWKGMRHLRCREGFRHRSWTLEGEDASVSWFGELEDAEAFFELAARETGLGWEKN